MSDEELGFRARYWYLLQAYLLDPSEEARARGYEFARASIAEGVGVIDFAVAQGSALKRMADRDVGEHPALHFIRAAEFLCECLTPYEMSHRAAMEGTRALLHVNDVLELEVKRVAHALHDDSSQLLAGIHLALADLGMDLPAPARERIRSIERMLLDVEQQLRELSHQLRPSVLDELGLMAAVELLVGQIARRHSLRVTVRGTVQGRLPEPVETVLYRVVQAALSNVVKHAHATAADVHFREGAGEIICIVADDGVGVGPIPAPGTGPGLGLRGMRERLAALGGTLQVTSCDSNVSGTRVRATVPVHAAGRT